MNRKMIPFSIPFPIHVVTIPVPILENLRKMAKEPELRFFWNQIRHRSILRLVRRIQKEERKPTIAVVAHYVFFRRLFEAYKVTHLLEVLGRVDFDLGFPTGRWAVLQLWYCPSKTVEHPKSKSTQPSQRGDGSP